MAKKSFVKKIGEYQELHRCDRTGIAWVEDGSTGLGHSAHPNIHATGSIRGMRKLGYWPRNERVIRSNGYKHNVDRLVVTSDLDVVAAKACRCVGCRDRRIKHRERIGAIVEQLKHDPEPHLQYELESLLRTAPDGTREEFGLAEATA